MSQLLNWWRTYVPSFRGTYYETQHIRRRIELLTPRENEIFRYIITGMLNKQIALKLGIAEKTVKGHRGRILEKLCVDSVAELLRLAEKSIIYLEIYLTSGRLAKCKS